MLNRLGSLWFHPHDISQVSSHPFLSFSGIAPCPGPHHPHWQQWYFLIDLLVPLAHPKNHCQFAFLCLNTFKAFQCLSNKSLAFSTVLKAPNKQAQNYPLSSAHPSRHMLTHWCACTFHPMSLCLAGPSACLFFPHSHLCLVDSLSSETRFKYGFFPQSLSRLLQAKLMPLISPTWDYVLHLFVCNTGWPGGQTKPYLCPPHPHLPPCSPYVTTWIFESWWDKFPWCQGGARAVDWFSGCVRLIGSAFFNIQKIQWTE